jgi:xylulokinase
VGESAARAQASPRPDQEQIQNGQGVPRPPGRSTEPLLLGLDIGSTNIKAAVFDRRGREVAVASRAMRTHYPRPGWARYDVAELWGETVAAIRDALARLEPVQVVEIAGVACASVGESGVPLDADGEPTYDAIAWFDTRTQVQTDRLEATIGRDALFGVTGLALKPIWSLCKLLWLREHEPEAFQRTIRWLNVADYVAYRFCGVGATDHSLASRTLAYDIRARRWSESLLADVAVPIDLWAPLVESGTALGRVTRRAAAETGLPTSTVVAAGGHDHVVGALAAGVIQPGRLLNSLGTAEAQILPVARPILDPRMGEAGYTQGAHVVPGLAYVLGGQHTAGAALDWARDVLGASHAALLAEAESVPPGSLGAAFLPDLRLASPPATDHRARGAWVGLSTDATRGALYRAVLEGLAFGSRTCLTGLLDHIGEQLPDEIIAIGGGTRNQLLMQIKATILNRPFVIADVTEATALGAAILAGIGAGVYRDAVDAFGTLQLSHSRVEPTIDDVARYNRLYESMYRHVAPTLRPLHREIDRLELTES